MFGSCLPAGHLCGFGGGMGMAEQKLVRGRSPRKGALTTGRQTGDSPGKL